MPGLELADGTIFYDDGPPPPPLSPASRRRELFTAWITSMPTGLRHGWVDSTGRDAAEWRAALRAETLRAAEEWLRREAEVRTLAAAARLGPATAAFNLAAIGSGPGMAPMRARTHNIGTSPVPTPASSLHFASLRFTSHLFASLRFPPHRPGRAREPLPPAGVALAASVPPGHVWWTDVGNEPSSDP